MPVGHLLFDEENNEVKRISTLLKPLEEIGNCLGNARKEPLNPIPLNKIKTLIEQVDVATLKTLENPSDNYVTEGTSLQERLDVVLKYANERLEAIQKIQPQSVYSQKTIERVTQASACLNEKAVWL